jgi:CheY-like chemotaxis protein
VGEFQKMLRHLIGAGVDLAVDTDPDLPVVRIDRTQVEQVLVNLALNARDAMPDGGLLRITTTRIDLDGEHHLVALEPGTYAFLSVSDTGSGMGPDVLDHLFEPFFTTKKAGRGTGLGLSTVYGIVQQNGGQIACESRAGEGTTFSIWLPAAAEGVTATTDAPVAEEQEDLAMIGKVVLVAEDEPAVRGLARRILERRGFRVLEAADGVEALEIAQAHRDRIDLLLTDAIMPRLGGRDLARRLAEQQPDVRVLFMSGYAESEIVHRGLLDPGIAFLEKPFTADELAAAVRTTLESDAQRILR